MVRPVRFLLVSALLAGVLVLSAARPAGADDATTASLSVVAGAVGSVPAIVGTASVRGLYVGSPGAATRSPRECLEMVRRVREMHVTDVFVEVLTGGFAWYKSDLAPGYAPPGGAFLDVLSILATESRREKAGAFRVHVVVSPLFALNPKFPYKVPAMHVTKQHPGWLCVDAKGQTRDEAGAQWLDPANPEVAAYARALVSEILTRYDVDGVCLADLRYPDANLAWGYGKESLGRFGAASGGGAAQPAPDAAEWVRWRARQVDSLAAGLRDVVRAKSGGLTLSVVALATGPAPKAQDAGEPEFKRALQYWPRWCEEGLADWLVLDDFQAQHVGRDDYLRWLDYGLATCDTARLVVAVSGAHNFDSGVAMQMRLALGRGVDGLLLHSYDQPALNVSPSADILAYIGKTIYSPDYVLPSYFQQAMLQKSPPVRDFPALVDSADLPQPVPIKPVKIEAPTSGTVAVARPAGAAAVAADVAASGATAPNGTATTRTVSRVAKTGSSALSQTDASLALLGQLDKARLAAIQAQSRTAPPVQAPLPPAPDLDFLGGEWLYVKMAHGASFEAQSLGVSGDLMRFRTRRRGVELNVPRGLILEIRPVEKTPSKSEK